MNKTLIPALLVATIMIAGAFALIPVEQASTVHLSGTVLATNLGGTTNGLTVSSTGVIADRNNVVQITDTNINLTGLVGLIGATEIGSATTGIQISTAGFINDEDASLILNDATEIGSDSTGIQISTAGVITDEDGSVTITDLFVLGTNGDVITSLQAVRTGVVTINALTANTQTCVDSGNLFTGLASGDLIFANPIATIGTTAVSSGGQFVDADSVSVCVTETAAGTANPTDVAWDILVIDLT